MRLVRLESAKSVQELTDRLFPAGHPPECERLDEAKALLLEWNPALLHIDRLPKDYILLAPRPRSVSGDPDVTARVPDEPFLPMLRDAVIETAEVLAETHEAAATAVNLALKAISSRAIIGLAEPVLEVRTKEIRGRKILIDKSRSASDEAVRQLQSDLEALIRALEA